MTAAELRSANSELEDLWSQIRVVEITTPLVRSAGDLAEAEALRGYDAVHLACALAVETTVFASSDRRLLDAAHRYGLAVSSPPS